MNKNYKIAVDAAVDAGKEIMKIYSGDDFQVEQKADNSPLTKADKNAHLKIMSFLQKTEFPVLSEEGKHLPYEERKKRDKFWLVDPLDGTKEFIKRNGEFTVNIAFIENGVPVFGVIYVPVKKDLYIGDAENGAFKLQNVDTIFKESYSEILQEGIKLPVKHRNKHYVVVGSRSHKSPETQAFFDALEKKHKHIQILPKGSSLKLCMLAEGRADIYPRLGPTMEWDTGAGHAIVLASGAKVYRRDNGKDLTYNKENLLNPFFIAER